MIAHDHQIRVRYGETDQMGYLYYGFYALYYEVGRAEWLRNLGFTYKGLEESGIIMPVMEMHSKYLRPAKYDDLIRVHTELREWPEQTITFHSELFNEADQLLNAGWVKLTFLDQQTMKRIGPPKPFLEAIKPFFEP